MLDLIFLSYLLQHKRIWQFLSFIFLPFTVNCANLLPLAAATLRSGSNGPNNERSERAARILRCLFTDQVILHLTLVGCCTVLLVVVCATYWTTIPSLSVNEKSADSGSADLENSFRISAPVGCQDLQCLLTLSIIYFILKDCRIELLPKDLF